MQETSKGIELFHQNVKLKYGKTVILISDRIHRVKIDVIKSAFNCTYFCYFEFKLMKKHDKKLLFLGKEGYENKYKITITILFLLFILY